MNPKHLSALRSHELETVIRLLHRHGMNGGRLLEIGAGTGQQARVLASRGYEVNAIDLPHSRYAPDRVWPVTDYDGQNLPFADDSFDIVYSSNVLEHVAHTDRMQQEISRVLRANGLAIHVLPSTAWRLLTMLMHYPWLVAATARLALDCKRRHPGQNPGHQESKPGLVMQDWKNHWRRIPYANRHGEHGNAFTEAYHFRRARWRNDFERNGFHVAEVVSSRLTYSGYALLGERLPMDFRTRLAPFLGSACNIFILRHTSPNSAA